MAGPNESNNRRPPNTLAELGSQMMPSSISRAQSGASPSETQRYQHLTQQIGRINEDPLYQLGQASPLLLTHPDAARQYRGLSGRLASYTRQQEIMEESAAMRANRMVATAVNQSFSSSTINGQISQRLGTTQAQQESLRMAANVEPESLQRRIAISERRMRGYGEEAARLETVNRFGERDPGSEERLQQLYGLREVELGRRTSMVGAARIHKMQGLDPQSRQDALINSVSQAQGMSGNTAADKLLRAFEKLAQETDTTSEQFKKLKKDVDDAEKGFKNATGGGGGGVGGGWQLAQGGFNAAAMATQQIGVNQRLAQMQNQAGYAAFENQRYSAYKGAMGGDIASMMLLGQFDPSMDFGKSLGTAAQAAVLARGGAGIAQMGAGGAQLGTLANPLSDVLGTSAAAQTTRQGLTDVMAGGATTAEAAMDALRGVSMHQATLAGAQARMEMIKQVQAIPAEQMQGFRDFGVGLGTAAQGMGLGGQKFLESTANAAQLDRLSQARIGPAQFAEMAKQGVNSMGSGFNQEQIFGARALERRGLGSMSENMERMSSLYAAGANNPQEGLGRILEQAIPKGFDNSKLVGQLVQYSSQMASGAGGAASGLNLTGATATLLTSSIGPGTANKEAMLQHAADIQGAFKGTETNVATSYAGMVSVARAQKTIGKGGVSAVIAESLPTEILMGLRDATGDQRKKALVQQGLSPNMSSQTIDKLIENRQMKELEAGGAGFVVNAKGGLSGLLGRIKKTGGKLGEQDMEAVGQIAALERINTGADVKTSDVIGRILGTGTKGGGGTGAGVFSDKDVGKLQKSMDDLRTQGFVQLSTAAAQAAKTLDQVAGAGKGIEVMVNAFKQLEKDSGKWESFGSTAGGKAAKKGESALDPATMKTIMDNWDKVGNKLSKVLDGIAARFHISIPSGKGGMHQ